MEKFEGVPPSEFGGLREATSAQVDLLDLCRRKDKWYAGSKQWTPGAIQGE